jgi:hypothetical protein
VMKEQDARQVLETVMANDGRDLSAHEVIRRLHQDADIRSQVGDPGAAAWETSQDLGLVLDSSSGTVPDL